MEKRDNLKGGAFACLQQRPTSPTRHPTEATAHGTGRCAGWARRCWPSS